VSDLVTLDRFVFVPDAEIARATLEAAGIEAVVVSDSSKPTEAVLLRVHADDAASAREILDARMELASEPADALENEEHCPRCFSIEIYDTESRAKRFARVIVLAVVALFGFQVAAMLIAFDGHIIDPKIGNGFFSIVMIASFFGMIHAAVAPKKRCRNCGLEWRGTQRPS
jgi:hypothetical protein